MSGGGSCSTRQRVRRGSGVGAVVCSISSQVSSLPWCGGYGLFPRPSRGARRQEAWMSIKSVQPTRLTATAAPSRSW